MGKSVDPQPNDYNSLQHCFSRLDGNVKEVILSRSSYFYMPKRIYPLGMFFCNCTFCNLSGRKCLCYFKENNFDVFVVLRPSLAIHHLTKRDYAKCNLLKDMYN